MGSVEHWDCQTRACQKLWPWVSRGKEFEGIDCDKRVKTLDFSEGKGWGSLVYKHLRFQFTGTSDELYAPFIPSIKVSCREEVCLRESNLEQFPGSKSNAELFPMSG